MATDDKNTEELQAVLDAAELMVKVTIGDVFHHVKTGGIYDFDSVVIRESDLQPLVIYRRRVTRLRWCRPLTEMIDGRFSRGATRQ
jgi:hypothetical protein